MESKELIELISSRFLQEVKSCGTVSIDGQYLSDFVVPRSTDRLTGIFVKLDYNYFVEAQLYVADLLHATIKRSQIPAYGEIKELAFFEKDRELIMPTFNTLMIRIVYNKSVTQHLKFYTLGHFVKKDNSNDEITPKVVLNKRMDDEEKKDLPKVTSRFTEKLLSVESGRSTLNDEEKERSKIYSHVFIPPGKERSKIYSSVFIPERFSITGERCILTNDKGYAKSVIIKEWYHSSDHKRLVYYPTFSMRSASEKHYYTFKVPHLGLLKKIEIRNAHHKASASLCCNDLRLSMMERGFNFKGDAQIKLLDNSKKKVKLDTERIPYGEITILVFSLKFFKNLNLRLEYEHLPYSGEINLDDWVEVTLEDGMKMVYHNGAIGFENLGMISGKG